MVKQTVVHPYQGIVLSHNKEQIMDTCNNLDESQRNYAISLKKQPQKVALSTIPFI